MTKADMYAVVLLHTKMASITCSSCGEAKENRRSQYCVKCDPRRCWCGGEDGEHEADAHAEEGRW